MVVGVTNAHQLGAEPLIKLAVLKCYPTTLCHSATASPGMALPTTEWALPIDH